MFELRHIDTTSLLQREDFFVGPRQSGTSLPFGRSVPGYHLFCPLLYALQLGGFVAWPLFYAWRLGGFAAWPLNGVQNFDRYIPHVYRRFSAFAREPNGSAGRSNHRDDRPRYTGHR
jgi:hypothetical protein